MRQTPIPNKMRDALEQERRVLASVRSDRSDAIEVLRAEIEQLRAENQRLLVALEQARRGRRGRKAKSRT